MASRPTRRYPFIAVEGCDRVGKSTTTQAIAAYIHEAINIHPTTTEFPYTHTELGGFIYKYMSNRYPDMELSSAVVHHLFSANRWERHMYIIEQLKIRPTICDRYVASGRAYTAATGGLTLEWCKQFDVGLPQPDLTIYMECEVEKTIRRRGSGLPFFETAHLQKEVKKQYEILRQEESDWITVDTTNKSEDEVLMELIPVIDNLLKKFRENPPPLKSYSIPSPTQPSLLAGDKGPFAGPQR